MSVDLSSFNQILSRLEGVADRLERGSPGGAAPAAGGAAAAAPVDDDAAIAVSFDEFLKSKAELITAAAATLNAPDVVEATGFFMDALRLLRGVLAATGKCRKPKDDEWGKFFGPIGELSQKAGKACDNRSDFFHNRKAAAEAMGVVSMVTVPGPPGHVQQILEMMDFHAIKVMQKKNAPETAWINALKTCLKEMIEWAKENCKMGLMWTANGEDPVEYFAATPLGSAPGAAKAPAAKGKGKGGAPPPPKGGGAPPKAGSMAGAPSAAPAGGGMAQCMADIAKYKDGAETGVWGGLKKVTDNMKAKNMKDVAVKTPQAPKVAPKKAAVAGRFAKGPKGEPCKYLQEEHSSWIVMNIDNDSNCVLDAVEMSQNVRITDCARSTINITSQRVKSIIIDNCEKVNIITKDVISIVELVNSDRCQIQTTGKVNMLSIDKCNGVMLHLNKDSLGAEIVTAKSSEMNVQIPDANGDEYDTIEIPIPEQFESKVVGRKLVTKVSSLYSD